MGIFNNSVWGVSAAFVRHILFWNVKIDVKWIENLPKKAVLAANHNHMWDPLVLANVVYRKTKKKVHTFADYKSFKPLFKSRLIGKIEKSIFKKTLFQLFAEDVLEQIPVCLGMRVLNKKAYEMAASYLRKGDYFAIFPQGGILNRKKGQLYMGVAKVAVDNKVPIVPIYLENDGKKDTISMKKDFTRYDELWGSQSNIF